MNTISIKLIRFYQMFLSMPLKQLLGVSRMCKVTPTCSSYALSRYKSESFVPATTKTIKRILSCK